MDPQTATASLGSESEDRALGYAREAERAALEAGQGSGASPRFVGAVGVIGAGTMGRGISMNFLSAGLPVLLTDASPEALEQGVGEIRRTYESRVARGRISSEEAARALALLRSTPAIDDLSSCDLVVEAVFEDMALKLDVFERLGRIAKDNAILASNTSFLNVDRLGQASGRPSDVLGMHFFSPAHIMRLVEVVRGEHTAADTLCTAISLSQRMGKMPVVTGICYGFIGNRMLMQRQEQAVALLLEGALPEQVDRVHKRFGMPMGPFEMADLAGVDIGWHRNRARVESIRDALCARGRWGQKSNAGFYDYSEPRKAQPSPVTREILEQFRAAKRMPSREIGEEEIVARTLFTMVNEGSNILEEGIARCASDIDVVWVHGFGWPAAKGGPMFWASEIGLGRVMEALTAYGPHLPSGFTISPRLRRLAATGQRFEGS